MHLIARRSGVLYLLMVFVWMAGPALLPLPAQESVGEDIRTLTLSRAYRLALERNELIRIARQDVSQAEDEITVATSDLLPELRLTGEARREKQNTSGSVVFGNKRNIVGTAEVTQQLYDGGKSWSGRQSARLGHRAEQLNYFRRRQEILLTVAERFYRVALARNQIEIERNSLRRSRRQLEQARGRYEVGAVTRTEVLRAEVQVSQAREQLERARNQYDLRLQDLALELGLTTTPDTIAEPPGFTFEDEAFKVYFERALKNRRDFRRQRVAAEQSMEELNVEKADWFPDVDLFAQGTRRDKEVTGQTEDWQAGVQASYPLFSGWKESAEIRQARAQYLQSLERISRLKREIRVNVRQSYLNIRTQRTVIQALENQVESARQNFEQVSAQFREGLANSVDVSDAITVLNEAENRLAIARSELQLDILRLRLATGVFQESLLQKEN